MQLYKDVSVKMSRSLTSAYSTSFSMGIRAFSPEYREPIYSIYGFVRIADEIVDTFFDYDQSELMNKFRQDTIEALETGISTNPVLFAFQKVVREYNIEWELVDSFLKSMEKDLDEKSHSSMSYDEYVYGSAEAVGLMCLKVFCKGDQGMYDKLKFPAKMLGSAFQKVNFLRDIKSDLQERGRIYLPDVHDTGEITDENKKKLEESIRHEFHEALKGIRQLPAGVQTGVYTAYLYFYFLFKKIESLDIKRLMTGRVRISNPKKLLLFLKSLWDIKVVKEVKVT